MLMHNKLRIAASLLSHSPPRSLKRGSSEHHARASCRRGTGEPERFADVHLWRGGAVEEGGRIGGRGDRNRFRNDLDDDPIAVVVHSAPRGKRDRRSRLLNRNACVARVGGYSAYTSTTAN